MKRKVLGTVARSSLAFVVVMGASWRGQAQNATAQYPSMAPLDQYLIADRNAEIALARSAAPAISMDRGPPLARVPFGGPRQARFSRSSRSLCRGHLLIRIALLTTLHGRPVGIVHGPGDPVVIAE